MRHSLLRDSARATHVVGAIELVVSGAGVLVSADVVIVAVDRDADSEETGKSVVVENSSHVMARLVAIVEDSVFKYLGLSCS